MADEHDDVVGNPQELRAKERLKHFNKMLIFIMVCVSRTHSLQTTVLIIPSYLAFCALNYGYDVGTFAGVQAMQSFAKDFGEYNEETELWALPGWLSSVMTATPFFGKAIVSGTKVDKEDFG